MSEWQEPSAIAFHRDKAPLAIALLSDTASEFDKVDIGRASQNMTLVACERGLGRVSCLALDLLKASRFGGKHTTS